MPTAFGANSFASALGSSTRRDPGAADRTYHGRPFRPLKTGTFYFARKRSFLLCLDTVLLVFSRLGLAWRARLVGSHAHQRLRAPSPPSTRGALAPSGAAIMAPSLGATNKGYPDRGL